MTTISPYASSAELSDFCRITQGGKSGLSGKDFVKSGYPAYGAGGLNGYLPEYEFDEPAIVLSSIGARCGKCFLPTGKWASLANTQLIFPDPRRADIRFVWYQLNDESSWHRSGTGQPFIKPSDVKARRVYLPPLPEQKRIADILDKADAIRRKRQELVSAANMLVPALFHETFGDPILNPHNWPTMPLGVLLASIDSGWSPKCEDRQALDDHWGVLKLGAVTYCKYSDTENKALPQAISPRPELEARQGDLLFSRKNTYELVAACALVRETRPKLMLSDLIFRLRIKEAVPLLPEYLWQLLIHPRKRAQIQKLAAGSSGSMPNISKQRLAGVSIALPPRKMQANFAKVLHASLNVGKKLSCEVAAQSENLFHSLVQRAFNGEL